MNNLFKRGFASIALASAMTSSILAGDAAYLDVKVNYLSGTEKNRNTAYIVGMEEFNQSNSVKALNRNMSADKVELNVVVMTNPKGVFVSNGDLDKTFNDDAFADNSTAQTNIGIPYGMMAAGLDISGDGESKYGVDSNTAFMASSVNIFYSNEEEEGLVDKSIELESSYDNQIMAYLSTIKQTDKKAFILGRNIFSSVIDAKDGVDSAKYTDTQAIDSKNTTVNYGTNTGASVQFGDPVASTNNVDIKTGDEVVVFFIKAISPKDLDSSDNTTINASFSSGSAGKITSANGYVLKDENNSANIKENIAYLNDVYTYTNPETANDDDLDKAVQDYTAYSTKDMQITEKSIDNFGYISANDGISTKATQQDNIAFIDTYNTETTNYEVEKDSDFGNGNTASDGATNITYLENDATTTTFDNGEKQNIIRYNVAG